MDLKAYYAKVREAEETISDPWVLVISSETDDGGVLGRATEVSRRMAAKLIVDGKARLAEKIEIEKHRSDAEDARIAAERAAKASKLQVTIVAPESEVKPLRPAGKPRG